MAVESFDLTSLPRVLIRDIGHGCISALGPQGDGLCKEFLPVAAVVERLLWVAAAKDLPRRYQDQGLAATSLLNGQT